MPDLISHFGDSYTYTALDDSEESVSGVWHGESQNPNIMNDGEIIVREGQFLLVLDDDLISDPQRGDTITIDSDDWMVDGIIRKDIDAGTALLRLIREERLEAHNKNYRGN